MRHALAIIAAIAVWTPTLAALLPIGAAQAQTGAPATIYKTYIPLIAGPAGSQTAGTRAMADQVFALVNSERASHGCDPLSLDPMLTEAAQAHSEDMAVNNYFDHIGADGSDSVGRVTRAGYNWQMTGENIAAGYTSAAAVMDGWMQSAGHRANILNCGFTQIGIGYAYEDDDDYPGPYGYGHYWAQVFGTPLGDLAGF